MDYALRSITFSCDLISRTGVKHAEPLLQKLHSALFADPNFPYKNFSMIPGGAQLANPSTRQGAASNVLILPDRIRVQEQATGCGRDEFEARIRGIAQHVLEGLRFEGFAAQQFVIQSLINPRRWNDAREFMANAILELDDEELAPLGRKPGLYGLRLAFPATAESPQLYNVRIESYSQDARSIFLENIGVYNKAIQIEDVALIGERFQQTYTFLEQNVGEFLSKLDSA